jgi:putative molybdopterin biosynthesis protein
VHDSPFVSDVPVESALRAWSEARTAAACPDRLDAVTVALEDAVARVTAEPVWATRSSPVGDLAAMDGISVRSADTSGASQTSPLLLAPGTFEVVDTGDPLTAGHDAVVMREHVHYVDTDEGEAAEIMAAVPPYQHVRSIGEDVSAGELLLPEGHRR